MQHNIRSCCFLHLLFTSIIDFSQLLSRLLLFLFCCLIRPQPFPRETVYVGFIWEEWGSVSLTLFFLYPAQLPRRLPRQLPRPSKRSLIRIELHTYIYECIIKKMCIFVSFLLNITFTTCCSCSQSCVVRCTHPSNMLKFLPSHDLSWMFLPDHPVDSSCCFLYASLDCCLRLEEFLALPSMLFISSDKECFLPSSCVSITCNNLLPKTLDKWRFAKF